MAWGRRGTPPLSHPCGCRDSRRPTIHGSHRDRRGPVTASSSDVGGRSGRWISKNCVSRTSLRTAPMSPFSSGSLRPTQKRQVRREPTPAFAATCRAPRPSQQLPCARRALFFDRRSGFAGSRACQAPHHFAPPSTGVSSPRQTWFRLAAGFLEQRPLWRGGGGGAGAPPWGHPVSAQGQHRLV